MTKAAASGILSLLLSLSLAAAAAQPAWEEFPGRDQSSADGFEADVEHLAQIERQLGPDHPQVALLLARLARAYEQTDPRRAEEHYRRAIAILSEAEAKRHSQYNQAGLVGVRKLYAGLLRGQGRTWEAVTEESRAEADQQELDWALSSDRGTNVLDLQADGRKRSRRAR